MTPDVFTEVVNPGLRQRKGWVIFIGTPKGMNHFYDILQIAKQNPQDWYHVIYKASETGILTQPELKKARAVMSEEEYMQEFECSFTAALVGAYYGTEIRGLEDRKRIGDVAYDPALPTDTYWDLGIDDTVLVLEEWWQVADTDVAVFVDGESEHRTAVLAVPFWIIGAATKERDAERRSADDHPSTSGNAACQLSGSALVARARFSFVPRSKNCPSGAE